MTVCSHRTSTSGGDIFRQRGHQSPHRIEIALCASIVLTPCLSMPAIAPRACIDRMPQLGASACAIVHQQGFFCS
jgi:hypothetical protein